MNAARVGVAGVENLEGARESWRNVLDAILGAIGIFALIGWCVKVCSNDVVVDDVCFSRK